MVAEVKRPFVDYDEDDWNDFVSNALANFLTIGLVLALVVVYAKGKRPRLVRAIVEAS